MPAALAPTSVAHRLTLSDDCQEPGYNPQDFFCESDAADDDGDDGDAVNADDADDNADYADDDDADDKRKNLGGILDFTADCGGATLIDG